jgi:hypothetical protein
MSTVVTPAQIEKRLYDLSKEIDEAQKYSEMVEKNYFETKASYEIGLAKSRMKWASVSSPTGKNYTVQEREDMALIENEALHFAMGAAEATVRSVRANVQRIRTQVDIARSIGTSVRVAMEL